MNDLRNALIYSGVPFMKFNRYYKIIWCNYKVNKRYFVEKYLNSMIVNNVKQDSSDMHNHSNQNIINWVMMVTIEISILFIHFIPFYKNVKFSVIFLCTI